MTRVLLYTYQHPVTKETATVHQADGYLWINYSTGEAARWEVAAYQRLLQEGRTAEEAYLQMILDF